MMSLEEVAQELSRRHARHLSFPMKTAYAQFTREDHAVRNETRTGTNSRLFYEYFHADTGRGCGASHQDGLDSRSRSLSGNDQGTAA
jgi:hypothetical protein